MNEILLGGLILVAIGAVVYLVLHIRDKRAAPATTTVQVTTPGDLRAGAGDFIVPPATTTAALLPAYIDRDDLMKAIGSDFGQAVTLDGATVHNGTLPARAFVTAANGNVTDVDAVVQEPAEQASRVQQVALEALDAIAEAVAALRSEVAPPKAAKATATKKVVA